LISSDVLWAFDFNEDTWEKITPKVKRYHNKMDEV